MHVLNMRLIDNTPTGRLILHIMLSFVEFERELIKERTAAGKAIARQKPGYKEGRLKTWKTKLKKSYPSSVDVLHEMLPIRYVEYDNGTSHITGFTGAQVEICTAFGVPIPEACLSSTQKASLERKAAGRKRGRPKGSVNRKSMPV